MCGGCDCERGKMIRGCVSVYDEVGRLCYCVWGRSEAVIVSRGG